MSVDRGRSSMMTWPAEYEGLREEARAVANAAIELHAESMAGLDEDGRVAKGRELLALQDQDAPGGRDETIAGITCRVFDPAGDERRGTYFHIHGGAMMW